MSMKNSNRTRDLVAQCLNQLCYCMASKKGKYWFVCVWDAVCVGAENVCSCWRVAGYHFVKIYFTEVALLK